MGFLPHARLAVRLSVMTRFTHVRALLIPTNFYTDWVKPGYPYEQSPAN